MSKVGGAGEAPLGIPSEAAKPKTQEQSAFARAKAAFETQSRAQASPLRGRASAEANRLPIAAAVQEARRSLAATPAEVQEFNDLLDSLADQISSPNVPLRQIPQATLNRLIDLDVRIPRNEDQASIRRILSFLQAPEKITAEALRKSSAMEPAEAFAGLLAVTRAGGAEKDDAQLTLLAKNFKAIHSAVLKMENGPALAQQMVQGVFQRANEPSYQRFLINYVAPML